MAPTVDLPIGYYIRFCNRNRNGKRSIGLQPFGQKKGSDLSCLGSDWTRRRRRPVAKLLLVSYQTDRSLSSCHEQRAFGAELRVGRELYFRIKDLTTRSHQRPRYQLVSSQKYFKRLVLVLVSSHASD
jgi:hypothetical protein